MTELNEGVPDKVNYWYLADIENDSGGAYARFIRAEDLPKVWSRVRGLENTDYPPDEAVDRFPLDFEPDTSYYKFPGGVEVRQISAHLASFPAQIVQYAARSGRMDGKCKSEELSDRIRDFEKIRDFATWEIERLGDL